MRASVTAAWPAFCADFEGRLSNMYLDVKGLVTTGTGNLIDSIPTAQALPWLTKDGKPATFAQIAAEWKQIKARQSIKSQGGYAYVKYATLHLNDATITRLLLSKTAEFWTRLAQTLPQIEAFPADAQLALLDLSWQNGPAFLDAKSDGGYVWAGTRAALLAQDWSAAASHVPGTGRRAERRKRLFANADTVVRLGLDRDQLWDQTTPVKTTPATPLPVVTPTPTPPPEALVKHSSRYGNYVYWRGGNIPPVVRDVLTAIPSTVALSQGGLSTSVAASAHTHDGLGAYDINVHGWSKARILTLCAELIRSGECAFPRGSRWGSGIFVEHVHVCSSNAYDQLHPDAQAQVRDFKHDPRRNGLVGHGPYVGPDVPLGSWKDSPYSPANIKTEPGVFYVASDTLLGLDVDRAHKEDKVKGDRISYVRQVKRWGRWNAVTSRGNFFAIGDGDQKYLSTEKVVA